LRPGNGRPMPASSALLQRPVKRGARLSL
jgi:hypothetical protein